jgi:hypothetical protein
MPRRRWGRIIVGILGIVFLAVPLLIVGVVLLIGTTIAGQIDPEAEGRVPGEVTFDAGDERYVVALGSRPGSGTRSERRVFTGESAQVRCTVTHPDGSTSDLRGDRQATSVETTGNYETIGEFTGKGGETTVECVFTSETDALGTVNDAPLIVHDKNEELQYVGFGLIAASVVVIAVSVLLIVTGARRRA